ncbi:MAG: hypothetical protein JWO38_4405 [Gemmataceae bacterium]|nr:hypothetical protein [Gemmataceae bacterium]
MHDEHAFLAAIRADLEDDLRRLVYADWLDDRGDPRGPFLRLHLALRAAGPDHLDRVPAEHELSRLRVGLDPAWLAVVEPELAPRRDDDLDRLPCRCFDAGYEDRQWPALSFHTEPQDTECDSWKRLLDLVEEAAADGRKEFIPGAALGADQWSRIVTLPPTIGKLTAVRRLYLYGSHLVRIPPEIGRMTALEEFDPYTSYRLHWFPYEITRCPNLRKSRVSTRALYGNFKYRPPFPQLDPGVGPSLGQVEPSRLPLRNRPAEFTRPCSVCGRPFEDRRLHRVWISLRVATDVLPLLVNACSEDCIKRLPGPPDGYVPTPHRGGPDIPQPPTNW